MTDRGGRGGAVVGRMRRSGRKRGRAAGRDKEKDKETAEVERRETKIEGGATTGDVISWGKMRNSDRVSAGLRIADWVSLVGYGYLW